MSSVGPNRAVSSGNSSGGGGPLATGRRSRELEQSSSEAAGSAADFGRPTSSLLAVIWRQRWIVLLCALLSLTAGIVYLAKATPIYASSSVVYVQQSGPRIMSDLMASGQRSNGYIITQCQVITSTAIVRSAIAKPGIEGLPSLRSTGGNPVGLVKSMISAEPDKAGELITVSAEGPARDDAAAIVNAVVDSYIEYVGLQYKSTALDFARILQDQINRYGANLQSTNAAMLRLKRDNPDLVSTADRMAGQTSSRLAQVNEELTRAQLRQLDLGTALTQARAVREDPFRLKRVLDQYQVTGENVPAVDPALMGEYRQLRMQVDELMIRLGPRHDSVVAAQRQLARVEAEVADTTRSSAGSMFALLEQSVATTNARVLDLQREAQAIRASSVDLNVKQVEYDQLAQEAERIGRSLDQLDARLKEINVTEEVGALNVSVLEKAQPAGMPVRPARGKTLAMAVMAGLMLGVGIALLRDTLDHRLRSVDEITAVLDVPLLGAIPHIAGKGAAASDRGRFVHAMPRSAVAEAFRTLRTAVYFGTPEGTAGTSILVTSPAPGDGKSTTASNLAIAFAQAGRRVLLIDADCRRPTQARLHGLSSAPGLADVLADKVSLADAVKPTSIDGLWLLPAGEIPANPSELLDSANFRGLLADVANTYDQVIIDSPPIVPVTDARVIAAVADVTVLVLRAERSTRRLANHARDALATVGARLIGVVVSDVPLGSQSYGYGYYGTGRYGYSNHVQVDVGGATDRNGDSPSASSPRGSTTKRERVAGELVNDPSPPTRAKPSK